MSETETVEYKSIDSKLVYKPFTPSSVKTLSITSGYSLPLLLNTEGPIEAQYTINGKSVTPYLLIKTPDGNYETPLSLCKYLKPSGDFIYNASVCSDVTQTNRSKVQHNQCIIEILNKFITSNDISTSAGLLTLPSRPIDYTTLRLEEIKKLYSDKASTFKRAILYLAERGLYCCKDFQYDDAFETANRVCFEEICKERPKKAKNGKIRVVLEGSPPSWWDGVSETDSAGNRVRWACGEGHTFVTPNVIVSRVIPSEVAPVAETTTSDLKYEDASKESTVIKPSSEFDEIFKQSNTYRSFITYKETTTS